jgi:collagenase-like PrtC family protease
MNADFLELLAPAGDRASLEAALEAGAGAVYFGLTTLNARRAARNFRQDELAEAVRTVHAHAARAYLTLNIDLAERELGQAARILELARQCGADAVLVRDPALFALRAQYPELEFHFSTQTSMTNSADVAAAGRLGASRVVLARELTLSEIAAAAADSGVRTEVFVQGAMCFSVSGRCLLSSWVGGRSGNRGTCTSPCRVPWSVDSKPAGTPLSMHDLAVAGRLDDLRRAGVTALKIEGRLKNADWVGRAVRLYREALDRAEGQRPPEEDLLARAAQLGAYTGRAVTCDYLDGRREHLTGESGRVASGAPSDSLGEAEEPPSWEAVNEDASGPSYDFSIRVEPRGIVCRFQCEGRTAEWTVPKTVVRRAHKAIPIGHVFELLGAGPIQGFDLRETSSNAPEFLMVPRAVNALMGRIAAAIRQARKGPADAVRVELPQAVEAVLQKGEPHEANRRRLGDKPDRARLDARAVRAFLRQAQPEEIIVEGVTASTLERLLEACKGEKGDSPHLPERPGGCFAQMGTVPFFPYKTGIVVALPQVFFEDDLPRIRRLVAACKAARVPVEVNSWGGWQLAQQADVRMESGPGLPVLNSLAARVLREAGIRCVTLSPEADRRQLEELTAHCPAPCSLVVFGRPPLVTTRAGLPESSLGRVFEDRRGVRLLPALEQGLVVFRPLEPFELRDLVNERIRVCHLVVDLVGSDDPPGDWHSTATNLRSVPHLRSGPTFGRDQPPLGAPGADRPFRFNYDRTLA